MAKIEKGSIFAAVPDVFTSSYPSDDALAEGQLGALLTYAQGTTPELFSRLQAETLTGGLQRVLREKATLAGDFLTKDLPLLAYFKTDALLGQIVPQGLFGPPSFPSSLIADDFVASMVDVGLDMAMNMISAVPIVGRFAQLFCNIGIAVAEMFTGDEPLPEIPLLVPWSVYTRTTDEELVDTFLVKQYGGASDWTPVWLPALGGTWRYERASDKEGKEMDGAWIYAPITQKGVGKGVVDWTPPGLGAIPNTMRQAGPVQTYRPPGNDPNPYMAITETKNANYVELARAPRIIDTGAFKPAFSAIAGQLWQQVAQPGSPDMFKVRALALRDAWQDYWGAFFEDAFATMNKGDDDYQSQWLWAALTPYICLIQQQGKRVLLGMRNITRPHNGRLITPKIFEPGHGPATIATRTGALYLETKSPNALKGDHDAIQIRGMVMGKDGFEADMAMVQGNTIIRGARTDIRQVKGTNGMIEVYAVPWPSGEEMMSYYQRPDVAITTPACEALAQAQAWSLRGTLVCAYVRPVKVGKLAAYGAFGGPEGSPGAKLRDDCLAIRKKLLTHPARFGVALNDVEAIDPPFADDLRKAGVTQSGGLKLKSNEPLFEDPGAKPSHQAPADGLPVEPPVRTLVPKRGTSGGGVLAAAAAGTVVIAGAAWALNNARRTYVHR